jgi:nucleoside 2-deoxyribosyltransferase
MKPKVIVLCGSSKFCDIMAVCGWLLERNEKAIVMGLHLLPFWYSPERIPDHLAEHEGVSKEMDELHLRKIDRSDEIFVVNHEDYIGDSTRREIEYAKQLKKRIRWYWQEARYREDVANRIRAWLKENREKVI